MGNLENGKMGKWENGKMGKWEIGKMGKWENGKMGKWENGKPGAIAELYSVDNPIIMQLDLIDFQQYYINVRATV